MSRLIERIEEEHKLEMTPMIDVTFLLLVFFLCTLKIRSLEGRLGATLPHDAGPAALALEPPETIDVSVVVRDPGVRVHVGTDRPWDGSTPRFDFAGRELAYRIGPLVLGSASELRVRLAQLHATDPERPVVLRAGSGSIYADVVGVLDAILAAGFDAVRFGTGPGQARFRSSSGPSRR